MSKGLRIAILITAITVVIVISYFLFIKKGSKVSVLKEKGGPLDQNDNSVSGSSSLSPQVSSGSSSGGSNFFSSTPKNPFSTSSGVCDFQKFVRDKMNDLSILGPSGVDCKWGKDTAKAWEKYGAAYKASNTSTTTESEKEANLRAVQLRLASLKIPFKLSSTKNSVVVKYVNPASQYFYEAFYGNDGSFALKRTKVETGESSVVASGATYNMLSNTPGSEIIYKGVEYEDKMLHKRPEKPVRLLMLALNSGMNETWANAYKPA